MSVVADVRESLVAQLEVLVKMLGAAARERPDGAVASQSIAALTHAAAEIAKLSDDDPRLVHMTYATKSDDPAVVAAYGQKERRIIDALGRGPATGWTADDLLADLANAADNALRESFLSLD